MCRQTAVPITRSSGCDLSESLGRHFVRLAARTGASLVGSGRSRVSGKHVDDLVALVGEPQHEDGAVDSRTAGRQMGAAAQQHPLRYSHSTLRGAEILIHHAATS